MSKFQCKNKYIYLKIFQVLECSSGPDLSTNFRQALNFIYSFVVILNDFILVYGNSYQHR